MRSEVGALLPQARPPGFSILRTPELTGTELRWNVFGKRCLGIADTRSAAVNQRVSDFRAE
jgi:hypothetical protein